MDPRHGTPCWYELSTAPGAIDAAGAFYGGLLDWQIASAGMEGFDYRLARSGSELVAGLWATSPEPGQRPPMWMIYFTATDGEATLAAIRAAGGQVLQDLAMIPGTGRFAIATDPQGAVFGLLEPQPRETAEGTGNAFDQARAGHGHWHELAAADPDAAFAFYAAVFGWQKARAVDMGPMGSYQIFSHAGTDLGGIMPLGPAPCPAWLPYFGTPSIAEAQRRTTDAGGALLHGPMEVPGGATVFIARDPQGARFALVSPAA